MGFVLLCGNSHWALSPLSHPRPQNPITAQPQGCGGVGGVLWVSFPPLPHFAKRVTSFKMDLMPFRSWSVCVGAEAAEEGRQRWDPKSKFKLLHTLS